MHNNLNILSKVDSLPELFHAFTSPVKMWIAPPLLILSWWPHFYSNDKNKTKQTTSTSDQDEKTGSRFTLQDQITKQSKKTPTNQPNQQTDNMFSGNQETKYIPERWEIN